MANTTLPASPASENTSGRFYGSSVHAESSAEMTPVIRNFSPSPSQKNRPTIHVPPHPSPSPMSQSGNSLPRSSPASHTAAVAASPMSKKKLSLASSRATRRMLRNRAKEKTRDRIAGGAAAKLIGPEAKQSNSTEDTSLSDKQASDDGGKDFDFGIDKIEQLRERAKEEWKKGKEDNKRYMPSPPRLEDTEEEEPETNKKELPGVLNREEVFHQSANDAVASLLSPSKRASSGTIGGGGVEDSIVTVDDALNPKTSAFRAPNLEESASVSESVASNSVRSGRDSIGKKSIASPSKQVLVLDTTYNSRRPTVKPLMSPEAEKKIELLKDRMRDPSKTLADLLAAICSPSDGKEMDRGYLVRRKNACGALKVLTLKPENRRTICFTVGVLPALTSVLEDAGDEGTQITFPDPATRTEYLEARKRAVANLLYLSMPKENRCAVFHSPGLVRMLIKTIAEDDGESRQGCCAILAYLARTVDNRILMVHVPDLIDTITSVIDPNGQSRKIAPLREFLSGTSASLGTYGADDEGSATEDEEIRNESTLTDDTAFEEAYTGTDNDDSTLNDSDDETPTTSPSGSPRKVVQIYDNDPNEFLNGARQYVFAVLSHLVKEKENAFHLARHESFIRALVAVSKLQNCASHTLAVVTLASLTRHRDNSKWLVFRVPAVVPAFVTAAESPDDKGRKYACYGLQNLSQEKACRQDMATTAHLLTVLCNRARHSTDEDEKLGAISALKNLTDEPANLVPMTNAPQCLATFMHIAHGQKEDVSELMQYRACDGLATLSHWLRKIATSGQATNDNRAHMSPRKRELFVPSLKVVTWSQWE